MRHRRPRAPRQDGRLSHPLSRQAGSRRGAPRVCRPPPAGSLQSPAQDSGAHRGGTPDPPPSKSLQAPLPTGAFALCRPARNPQISPTLRPMIRPRTFGLKFGLKLAFWVETTQQNQGFYCPPTSAAITAGNAGFDPQFAHQTSYGCRRRWSRKMAVLAGDALDCSQADKIEIRDCPKALIPVSRLDSNSARLRRMLG